MIKFTLRQREILQLVAQGQTNFAIGLRLGISEQTVKNHLNVIYRGLNVRDPGHSGQRILAVLYAMKTNQLRGLRGEEKA